MNLGDAAAAEDAAPLRLAHPDWLAHQLTICGPGKAVAALRTAAAGAGIIPWRLELEQKEEDWFHLLMAPSAPQQCSLSAAGARILAGQLREAAERRHRLAASRARTPPTGSAKTSFPPPPSQPDRIRLPPPHPLYKRQPNRVGQTECVTQQAHMKNNRTLTRALIKPNRSTSGRTVTRDQQSSLPGYLDTLTVEPDQMADDPGREAMVVKCIRSLTHAARLRDPQRPAVEGPAM